MFAFNSRQKGGLDVPNTRSAEKRVRVTARRTLRNRMIRSRMKTAIRRYHAAVAEGNLEAATELFRKAVPQGNAGAGTASPPSGKMSMNDWIRQVAGRST